MSDVDGKILRVAVNKNSGVFFGAIIRYQDFIIIYGLIAQRF
jgi:hypothetical protein